MIEKTGMTLKTFVLGGESSEGFDLDDGMSFEEFKKEVSSHLGNTGFNVKELRCECHDDNPEDIYQFTADEEELTMLYLQYLGRLADRIRDWNQVDVCELRDMLNALKRSVEDLKSEHHIPFDTRVDMSNLPTWEFPSELSDYPVWAMDGDGNCLVGANAQDIEHIDEIISNAHN